MSRFRCVLGPTTDCEFRKGIWCKRARVEYEGVVNSHGGGEAVCKMRKRQLAWIDIQDPRCRYTHLGEEALHRFPSYKKRGTEEEGMLNCVLGKEGGKDCVHYCQGPAFTSGRCNLSYVSGHVLPAGDNTLRGKESCDQYKEKEELARCHVCGVVMKKIGDGTVHLVGGTKEQASTVLCIYCHAIYDSIVHGKRSSYGHIGAMNMLKGLVARGRENIAGAYIQDLRGAR